MSGGPWRCCHRPGLGVCGRCPSVVLGGSDPRVAQELRPSLAAVLRAPSPTRPRRAWAICRSSRQDQGRDMHEFGLVAQHDHLVRPPPTAAYRRPWIPGTATLQFRSVASSFCTSYHPFYQRRCRECRFCPGASLCRDLYRIMSITSPGKAEKPLAALAGEAPHARKFDQRGERCRQILGGRSPEMMSCR